MAEFIQLPDMRMHGDHKWELLTDCIYSSDILKPPTKIRMYVTVPSGTVTDLASIPRIPGIRFLFPVNDKHRPAAIVHDHLCTVSTNRKERILADAVFREAMAVCGVGRLKRTVMWAAVRLMTQFKRFD